MIGQRDVRCWDEIRNRRTRNIRNIWAETLGLGFIRRASLRRSEEEREGTFENHFRTFEMSVSTTELSRRT